MKTVEVSESALDSLKAMVEQLQSERDELLSTIKRVDICLQSSWFNKEWLGYHVRASIAKCTQTQSICDWQDRMPR